MDKAAGKGKSAAVCMKRARIGVFGGTFDPIHNGHIALATEACEAAALDRLIIIPSARPPHKPGRTTAPFSHRCEMARLAAGRDPRFEVSGIEAAREGPSYTIDTLRELRRMFGRGPVLFLVIGSDSVFELGTWRSIGGIFRLARFIVAQRPGASWSPRMPAPEGLTPAQAAALSRSVILGTRSDESSTEVRRRIAEGLGIEGLVPGPVAEYIAKHRLYMTRRRRNQKETNPARPGCD